MAVLAAERHRRITGEGQLVELALKDVALAMLGNLGILGEVMVNGVDRPKYGNALYGAFGQDFPTADGRRIMIVALTHRQWTGLLKVTGLGEAAAAIGHRLGLDLDREGDRFHARKELAALFAPWFASRRVDEFAATFDKAAITWSEFRSFAQAVREDTDLSPDHPMFALMEQPGIGSYLMPGLPIEFGAHPREAPRPAPVLGEHTDQILAEVVGLDSAAIGRLHDQGVVAGPRR
jgi:2-methylfumaryl-CoA isomerase